MKNQAPVIRRMRRADCAAVAKMNQVMQAYPMQPTGATSVKAGFFARTCLGPRKQASVWVALVGKEYAGFAVTQDYISFGGGYKYRHMLLLWVGEQFRGQGIAKGLITKIRDAAFLAGCKRFDTRADVDNHPANKLYRAAGFKKNPISQIHYRMLRS